jgi:hypothetical protein
VEVVDQRKDLLGRRVDARGAFHAEGVGPGGREDQQRGNGEDENEGDFLEHGGTW